MVAKLPVPLKVATTPAKAASTAVTKASAAGAAYTPSFLNKVSVVDAGFKPVLQKQGIAGVATKFAKSKPAKVGAVVAAAAVAGGVLYDEAAALLDHSDPTVAEIARQALEKVAELKDSANVEEPFESLDGKIGDQSVADFGATYAVIRSAENSLKDAIGAVGSLNRLKALMTWLNMDDDLQALVMEAHDGH